MFYDIELTIQLSIRQQILRRISISACRGLENRDVIGRPALGFTQRRLSRLAVDLSWDRAGGGNVEGIR